jgi:hypothetical protein
MQQPNEKSFERRKFIHTAAMAGAAAIAAPVLGRVLTQVTGSSQISAHWVWWPRYWRRGASAQSRSRSCDLGHG